MPTFNFKREAKVYVKEDDSADHYRILVSDITFGQTFAQNNYSTKTIHTQTNFFEGSVINKANPATFDFSFPVLEEDDYEILESRFLDAAKFELFIKTEADVFRLESCVITNAVFGIERNRPLSLQIQGEASRLHRGATLPAEASRTERNKELNPPTYIMPEIAVTLGTDSIENITSVSMELQNDISWTPYTTLQNSLSVTSASNSMYPSGFTVNKKTLAGSIQQYLTDGNTSDTLTWDTSVTLDIRAGVNTTDVSDPNPTFRGFRLKDATCSFTNRINTGDLFLQSYDWRMVESPSNLGTKLEYATD